MIDYNILLIDDERTNLNAMRGALADIGYKTTCIYPMFSEIKDFSSNIRSFAKKEEYIQMYFYIVKKIEEYNISAIFLDLNHDNKKANTTDRPSDEEGILSSGEKLALRLISNNLYKNIPITIYTRYATDDLKLKRKIRVHVGQHGLISLKDVKQNFTSKEIYKVFEKKDFKKIRIDDKVEFYLENKTENCDVGVICALNKEYQSVKNIISSWKTEGRYIHAFVEDENSETILNIILTSMGDHMGMVEASLRSVDLIDYAKPKYIGMSGIAGGNKNAGACLGDVAIAESIDNWQSGKYSSKEGADRIEITPDPRSIPVTVKDILDDMGRHAEETKIPLIAKIINDYGVEKLIYLIDEEIEQDKKYIQEINKNKNLNKNDKERKIKKINDDMRGKFKYPEIKVRDMMTGSSLVANERIINEEMENRNRKAFFFDMEGYAVAYIATSKRLDGAIIIKSIVDYGNHMKGDKWHKFACDASAQVLIDLMMIVKSKECQGLL